MAIPATSERARAGGVYPVVRLSASFALMMIGGSAMYGAIVVLEPVVQEFGTGRGGGSLPYTLFMVGFGVGGVAMGRLADRTGILVPALLGCVALAAGFFLAARAGSLWELGLAMGFCGLLGASFTFAPLVSDVSHWFTARRGLAVGIVISGTYVAGAVWPPILQGWFDDIGWRATFDRLGVLVLVGMLPLCALLVPRSPVDEVVSAHRAATPARPLGLRPNALQCLVCAAGIGCCVAMSAPQVHIVPLVLDLGHAAARGAEMLALMLGFGVVSRLVSGWLSDRIGALATLLIGSAAQCATLAAFLLADGLAGLYAASIAFGLAQGGIVPSYAMVVRTFFPAREAGWRIGAAMLFTIAGMAIGGWVAGVLRDRTGDYTASFLVAIGFNAVNLAIAATLLGRADARAPARAIAAGRPS